MEEKNIWGVSKYFCEFTCDEDSLLELVKLPGPDAFVIDTAWSLTCLMYSTSLNTFLSPPPGLCFTLSKDPILLCTLTFTFWSMIYQCGGYKEITVRFVHEKITWQIIKTAQIHYKYHINPKLSSLVVLVKCGEYL